MNGFPNLPPVWTLGAVAASYGLHRIFPLWQFDVPWLNRLGLAALLISFLMIVWCATWFWRNKTTIEPHEKPTTLIVQGPYRWSRNPIYVSMVVGAGGLALWFGSIGGAVPVVVLAVILHRLFVLPEENGLRQLFGDEAERYIKATRRWI